MRNPLSSIISNCDILERDDSLSGDTKARLKTMRISSNLLTSFLHDMIDWTQIKQNKFKKKVEKFNLKEMCMDVIDMLSFKAELKNIFCLLEFDEDIPYMVLSDNLCKF